MLLLDLWSSAAEWSSGCFPPVLCSSGRLRSASPSFRARNSRRCLSLGLSPAFLRPIPVIVKEGWPGPGQVSLSLRIPYYSAPALTLPAPLPHSSILSPLAFRTTDPVSYPITVKYHGLLVVPFLRQGFPDGRFSRRTAEKNRFPAGDYSKCLLPVPLNLCRNFLIYCKHFKNFRIDHMLLTMGECRWDLIGKRGKHCTCKGSASGFCGARGRTVTPERLEWDTYTQTRRGNFQMRGRFPRRGVE